MITMTLASTMLALAAPVASVHTPPIRLQLSAATYAPGDRARVHVKTAQDGYLVVVQQDANGQVRVLQPVDPTENAQIEGGHKLEIRSRGDRDAFLVTAERGSGMVLAARSDQPFDFRPFTHANRWDVNALDSTAVGPTPEAALLTLVDHMTNRPYDYDAVAYVVGPERYYQPPTLAWGPWWYGPGYIEAWPYYHPGIVLEGRFPVGRRERFDRDHRR